MTARIVRERGHVRTGARGRHAPHMSSLEVARILIAVLVSESPATGADRMPHYAALPLQDAPDPAPTFELALASLLERLAEDPDDARRRLWSVEIDLTFSRAVIEASRLETEENQPERHVFDQISDELNPKRIIEDRAVTSPFIHPVERVVRISGVYLAEIAEAVLNLRQVQDGEGATA